MKLSKLTAAASLLCLSLSSAALAAENSGFYLGAGFASNDLTSSCPDGYFSSCPSPSSGPKDDGHYRLVGGYDFDKHFGIEAGLSNLGTYRVRNSGGSASIGEFKASAVTLALKGGNTFSNGFAIFGKLGLAQVRTQYSPLASWTLVGSTDQKSSGFVGGVYGQYNINEHVGFRLSMEVIKYTDEEFGNFIHGIGLMAVFKL